MNVTFRSEAPPKPRTTEVFAGVPAFTGGEAVLIDAAQGAFPAEGTISRIEARVEGVLRTQIDRGLVLLLYVGDMAVPRARIRLADLVRLGGRPLNVHKSANEVLRVVLADPDGRWPGGKAKLVLLLAMG